MSGAAHAVSSTVSNGIDKAVSGTSAVASGIGKLLGGAAKAALYPVSQVGTGIRDWAVGKGSLTDVYGNLISSKEIFLKYMGNIYTNGILTSKESALLQARDLNAALFYNPSHGLIADLVESFLQKITGTSSIGRQLGGILSENPNEPVTIYAHSQGALTVSNALTSMFVKGDHLTETSTLTIRGGATNPVVTKAISYLAGVSAFSSKTNLLDPISVVQVSLNPFNLLGGAVGGPVTLAQYHYFNSYDF